MPIHSFKQNNIDLSPIGIKEKLKESYDPYNFINKMFKKTMFIPFSIGNPPQKVFAEVATDSTMIRCITEDKFQIENNLNFFNYSKTFTNSTPILIYKDFAKIRIYSNIFDDFYFKCSKDLRNFYEKKANFESYLVSTFEYSTNKKVEELNIKEFDVTFSFIFGMQIG
ncbi:MAG: hypothetical protein MJ252_08545, partial [archaeon]|nr:hypothetical protein [archaeon]